MSRGHSDTQRQGVGHLRGWNTAHLDTGGFATYRQQQQQHTFVWIQTHIYQLHVQTNSILQ